MNNNKRFYYKQYVQQGFVGRAAKKKQLYTKEKTQGRVKPKLNFYYLNYADMTGAIRHTPMESAKQRKMRESMRCERPLCCWHSQQTNVVA